MDPQFQERQKGSARPLDTNAVQSEQVGSQDLDTTFVETSREFRPLFQKTAIILPPKQLDASKTNGLIVKSGLSAVMGGLAVCGDLAISAFAASTLVTGTDAPLLIKGLMTIAALTGPYWAYRDFGFTRDALNAVSELRRAKAKG